MSTVNDDIEDLMAVMADFAQESASADADGVVVQVGEIVPATVDAVIIPVEEIVPALTSLDALTLCKEKLDGDSDCRANFITPDYFLPDWFDALKLCEKNRQFCSTYVTYVLCNSQN
jgi:hypothetical protein